MLEEQIVVPTDSVNKHYLEKVMDLSTQVDIEATEDIFDSRGMKLIAKGAKISRDLQEKLILHKLKKPLESSIAAEGAIDANAIAIEAQRIAETIQPVSHLLGAIYGKDRSPFDIMSKIRLGNSMRMMLTITERGGETAFMHSVMVSLVSVCLSKKLGLNENDQTTVVLAGLLHDIGELYVDPEYLNRKKRLLPHEWKHVIVHPHIGNMLIKELDNFPPAVGLAVAEHHERFDGAGYPRQTNGKSISVPGQVLSVAEMICGVFMNRDRPLERAELALKLIPGEHAHDLVSIISNTLRTSSAGAPPVGDQPGAQVPVQSLFDRIVEVQQAAEVLGKLPAIQTKKAKQLLEQALSRAGTIRRAFSSTGLDLGLQEDVMQDNVVAFEMAVATREIQWRLREMARDVALRSVALEANEAAIFQPLITLLDRDL